VAEPPLVTEMGWFSHLQLAFGGGQTTPNGQRGSSVTLLDGVTMGDVVG